jgi:hypothetical protein
LNDISKLFTSFMLNFHTLNITYNKYMTISICMGLNHRYGGYVEPQSGLYGICKLFFILLSSWSSFFHIVWLLLVPLSGNDCNYNYTSVFSDLFWSTLNLHRHFKYVKKSSNEKFLDIRELDENFLTYYKI